jgi:hypothetical protein
MTKLSEFVVEYFVADHIPNPAPGSKLPWRLYQTVRNAVVRTCRRHGPTGPLGELRLDKPNLNIIEDWQDGDEDPVYWVVDDQYNDERYLYMEFEDSQALSPNWLEDVTETLRRYPGWGIGVDSLADGYILIFADRLMVTGQPFNRCKAAMDVVKAGRTQIR